MDTQLPNAAEVLGQLSTALSRMLELLQVMVTTIRPSSANTLPTVSATLSGIAEATEHAALRVLDEAEALQEDQGRLTGALEKLRAKLPAKDTDAAVTWAEAASCSNALSARALKIMAAMEFQDLTTQHIEKTVACIEDVRGRLRNVLQLFDLQIREAVGPDTSPIGPVQSITDNEDKQALADSILAERR
jgi:chemotaxis regulatin CheY-phosphate phosphatase CheZ